MGQPLQVDQDRLYSLAQEYESLGDQARRSHEKLEAIIDEEGKCWGDDEPGQNFEETYLTDSQRLLDSAARTVESLIEEGKLLNETSGGLDNADQQASEAIRNAMTTPDGHGLASADELPRATGPGPPLSSTVPSTDNPIPLPHTALDSTESAINAAPAQHTSAPWTDSAAKAADPESAPSQPGITQASASEPTDSAASPSGYGTPAGTPQAANHRQETLLSSARTPNPSAVSARTGTSDTPAMGERRPARTPWSPNTPTSAAPNPGRVSAPPTSPNEARPPNAGPSAANRRDKRDERKPPAVSSSPPQRDSEQSKVGPADPKVSQFLERALTDRHNLQVVGFDTPGIDLGTLRAIAQALDDVLTEHPYLTLPEFVIGECGENVTRLEWDWVPGAHGPTPTIKCLTLDTAVSRGFGVSTDSVHAGKKTGGLAREREKRPVYSMIVRELGCALDIIGGFGGRPAAQKILITEYFSMCGDSRFDNSLGNIVRGFMQWRGQLSGEGFPNGRFDPGTALPEAFVEVQLNNEEASAPAHALRSLLVGMAKT